MSDTSTDENTNVADNNRSLDSYTRLAVPATGSTAYLSGSYFRLGTYVTEPEEGTSLYPSPYTDLDDDSAPDPDGVFLKTDGVLFQTIEGGSYQEFDDVLSIYAAKDVTVQSDETLTYQAPEIIIEADADRNTNSDADHPGKVSITGSNSIDVSAKGSDITMTAEGSIKTTVHKDHHIIFGGNWSSFGSGTSFSSFLGGTIGFFAGTATNIIGGLSLTMVNLFARVTVGWEFVFFGLGRMVRGLMDIKICSTNILRVDVEIKNSVMSLHRNTITMNFSNLGMVNEQFFSGNSAVNLRKNNINLSKANVLKVYM